MMIFECVADRRFCGDWRVEALDPLTGDCYVAIFSGPLAQERAQAYCNWMNEINHKSGSLLELEMPRGMVQ